MSQALRHGDLVEVKGPSEILATLDERGALDDLPFMPEMAHYCGRRFSVERRAEKVCDTIHYTGSRRLHASVLLDDLRCDGSGHDGCQAECRLFWKEAWLRKVSPQDLARPPFPLGALAPLIERTSRHTRSTVRVNGEAQQRFRCQATDLTKCTEHLKLWDLRAYVREYTSGNVSLGRFLRVTARAAVKEPMRKMGLVPEVHVPGTAKKGVVFKPLDLRPGELVRVKRKEDIAGTLNAEGRNRGLWFDREMLPYCGRTFRVRTRLRRFINDRDGSMVELKSEAVTLDGVVCSGDLSLRRWFCPRAIYPFWRECWLERVEPAIQPAVEPASGRG